MGPLETPAGQTGVVKKGTKLLFWPRPDWKKRVEETAGLEGPTGRLKTPHSLVVSSYRPPDDGRRS